MWSKNWVLFLSGKYSVRVVLNMISSTLMPVLVDRFGFSNKVSLAPEVKSVLSQDQLDDCLRMLERFLFDVSSALGVDSSNVLPVPRSVLPKLGIWFGKTGNARVNYGVTLPGVPIKSFTSDLISCNPVSGFAYLLYYYGDKDLVSQLVKVVRGYAFSSAGSLYCKEHNIAVGTDSFVLLLDEICDLYNRVIPQSVRSTTWLMSQVKSLRESRSQVDFLNFFGQVSTRVAIECRRDMGSVFNELEALFVRAIAALMFDLSSARVGKSSASFSDLFRESIDSLTEIQIVELAVASLLRLSFPDYILHLLFDEFLKNSIDSAVHEEVCSRLHYISCAVVDDFCALVRPLLLELHKSSHG